MISFEWGERKLLQNERGLLVLRHFKRLFGHSMVVTSVSTMDTCHKPVSTIYWILCASLPLAYHSLAHIPPLGLVDQVRSADLTVLACFRSQQSWLEVQWALPRSVSLRFGPIFVFPPHPLIVVGAPGVGLFLDFRPKFFFLYLSFLYSSTYYSFFL